jgi:hypothetical protein
MKPFNKNKVVKQGSLNPTISTPCPSDSIEGCTNMFVYTDHAHTQICGIKSFCALTTTLNNFYTDIRAEQVESNDFNENSLTQLNEDQLLQITSLLNKVDLDKEEIMSYAKVSPHKSVPYTRNCIYEDENYSLLLLVWRQGAESKIHSHPCSGCFILPLSGEITETVYENNLHAKKLDKNNDELFLNEEIFHNKHEKIYESGQVSFMADSIGQIHKIGSTTGAISLHLYTPSFSKCKVWKNEDLENKGESVKWGNSYEASLHYYSMNGRVNQNEEVDLDFFI